MLLNYNKLFIFITALYGVLAACGKENSATPEIAENPVTKVKSMWLESIAGTNKRHRYDYSYDDSGRLSRVLAYYENTSDSFEGRNYVYNDRKITALSRGGLLKEDYDLDERKRLIERRSITRFEDTYRWYYDMENNLIGQDNINLLYKTQASYKYSFVNNQMQQIMIGHSDSFHFKLPLLTMEINYSDEKKSSTPMALEIVYMHAGMETMNDLFLNRGRLKDRYVSNIKFYDGETVTETMYFDYEKDSDGKITSITTSLLTQYAPLTKKYKYSFTYY